MAVNIVFEGIEGAGKTLLAHQLMHVLRETTDFPVTLVREPGGSSVGGIIRNDLLLADIGKEMHPRTRMLLFSADRNELIENTIIPFNTKYPDGITIGDRTWPSTLALQLADGVDNDYSLVVQEPFMRVYPTKIFLLDIHEQEAAIRLSLAKENGREMNWRDKMPMETYAVHRRNYLDLAKKYPEKFVLLDGFKTPWETINETRNLVLLEMANNENFRERALKNISEFTNDKLQEVKYRSRLRGIKDTQFEEEHLLENVERMREKLRAPSKETLRKVMHEQWRELGLEPMSSGVERLS